MTVRPRTSLALATAVLALSACASTTAGAAQAAEAPTQAQLAHKSSGGEACSPRVDIEGYSDSLDEAVFDGQPVAGLSALAQDMDGHTAAVSDRSVLFSLDVRRHGAPDARATRATPLADEKGAPLDSEGLVVEHDGSRLVTSETEPSIRRYDRTGQLIGRLRVPRPLAVEPAGRAQQNATFEGLTSEHHGRTLIASMEGQLKDDGTDRAGHPLVRVQSWRRSHGGDYAPARQWAYPLDKDKGLGISETAATGDGRLLVLERGYDEKTGNTVRLYLADPRGADDVSGVEKLRGQRGARPLHKTLLADLGKCPDLGASHPSPQANPLLDNIEGLAVTEDGYDGKLRLLLVSDNNESAKQVTRLYALTARLPHGG